MAISWFTYDSSGRRNQNFTHPRSMYVSKAIFLSYEMYIIRHVQMYKHANWQCCMRMIGAIEPINVGGDTTTRYTNPAFLPLAMIETWEHDGSLCSAVNI